MLKQVKPSKPWPEFPLCAHASGVWCKKIRGKIRYFGPWDDPQAALDLYLDQKDALYAGRKPRPPSDDPTLGDAIDKFLASKKLAHETGEISQRSYADYEKTCKRIGASIGRERVLLDIGIDDLEKLRRQLHKGKNGELSPSTAKNDLTRARMLFLYANEYLESRVPYRKALRSPSRRLLRMADNERGPRMFEAADIRRMVKKAGPQLKAMILLGINCGFGNNDCATLPISKIDLKGAMHSYWRPKTHNPRSFFLWPETVKALKVVLKDRPEAKADAKGLVFVTRQGHSWAKDSGDNAVSSEFRDLLKALDLYQRGNCFYSLRRTFETIGATCGEQVALDYAMGHIPPSDDMSAVYRQKQFSQPLTKLCNHVRAWYLGRKKIV